MNNDIVLDVKSVSKKYVIPVGYQPDSLREKIVELIKYPIKLFSGTHKKRYKDYWALKDVTFQVKRGEVLGIVGRNGAGKSTLLKILSRVTEPTSGSITMKGRVSSLLEVGTGFNPELTGRENIYLNGAIIGMGKKEIKSKFNDIVEFAGIGDFLDTPVKRYSSGMYVRLGFAVAAHLDSDILILDEVLAVGDAEFHRKSYEKVKSLVSNGKSVVIVSHDMSAMRELANSVLIFENGKIVSKGTTLKTVNQYLFGDSSENQIKNVFLRPKLEGSNLLKKITINSASNRSSTVNYGERLAINIETSNGKYHNFSVELIIKNEMMERICHITSMVNGDNNHYSPGTRLSIITDPLYLAEGRYWIDINCRQFPHLHIDKWLDAGYFNINEAKPDKINHSIKSAQGMGSWIVKSKITEMAL